MSHVLKSVSPLPMRTDLRLMGVTPAATARLFESTIWKSRCERRPPTETTALLRMRRQAGNDPAMIVQECTSRQDKDTYTIGLPRHMECSSFELREGLNEDEHECRNVLRCVLGRLDSLAIISIGVANADSDSGLAKGCWSEQGDERTARRGRTGWLCRSSRRGCRTCRCHVRSLGMVLQHNTLQQMIDARCKGYTPSSMNSPSAEEHPGPPLIHITRSSVSGDERDSKNCDWA